MPHVESSIIAELEAQRPSASPDLLSRAEKDRLLQRGFHGLYRWYLDRSQANRNWNPDRSFDWRAFGQNHSAEVITIVEGFYAVEQYVPDYTAELIRITRADYGRSQFNIRWGSEEEKHADLWRNMLLFSRGRSAREVETYTGDLRANAWTLPFADPIRMLLYAVFQERATQINYLSLARIGRGENEEAAFAGDTDAVMAAAARTIAVDEAAHYDFFLEGARLYLYYYPEETLIALVDVLRNFAMPAIGIVPNYERFMRTLVECKLVSRMQFSREVVSSALTSLGIRSLREVERGIRKTRQVPNVEGCLRDTAVYCPDANGLDYSIVESAVMRLFTRIDRFEQEIGLSEVDPTRFRQNS